MHYCLSGSKMGGRNRVQLRNHLTWPLWKVLSQWELCGPLIFTCVPCMCFLPSTRGGWWCFWANESSVVLWSSHVYHACAFSPAHTRRGVVLRARERVICSNHFEIEVAQYIWMKFVQNYPHYPYLIFLLLAKTAEDKFQNRVWKGWPPNRIKQMLLSRVTNHECPIKGRWRSYGRALRLDCSRRKEEEPPWLGKNLSLLHVYLQGARGELPHDKGTNVARSREGFILGQAQAPFGFYAGELKRG